MVTRHDIILRAPAELANSGAPAILQRSDEDFVAAVLNALRDTRSRNALRGSLAQPAGTSAGTGTRNARARTDGKALFSALRQASARLGLPGGSFKPVDERRTAEKTPAGALEAIRQSAQGSKVLKLFQPIQGQFHLAVMEARCDVPGEPRLDPARVESAGLVIRRLHRDASGQEVRQGWMRAGELLRGWVKLDVDAPASRYDPDSVRRLSRPTTGQAALDQELAGLLAQSEDALFCEQAVPMFVAPPDVCAAAGSTYFYGLIPTTSSERASAGAPSFDADRFGAASDAFLAHLAGPLRGQSLTFPRAGRPLRPSMADIAVDPADSERSRMRRLIGLLRQLAAEFDAFGDSSESLDLLRELNRIELPLLDAHGKLSTRTTPAGDFLARASRVLLGGEDLSPDPIMPAAWPGLDKDTRDALARVLSDALRQRFAALTGVAGRFDEPGARYVLRAFVRLKPHDQCPARTVWSDYGTAFVIAPWYEGSGAPPVQVPLPDPGDRDMLRQLKPNVAFTVPRSMQNLLSGDPQDLLEGKKPPDDGLKLDWICAFNIPIITICAFIVLNIFLSLFNLFFRWLMFIKICIPFPRKG